MDKIQFENKYEIDEVISALETFSQEHPSAREKDTIQKLCKLLDAMYVEW